MKLFEKIKKFIVVQKSCPHCASRGMFVFNNITESKKGKFNEKLD